MPDEIDLQNGADAGADQAAPPTVQVSSQTPFDPEALEDDSKQWYIIHSYSGFEQKVASSRRLRIRYAAGRKPSVFPIRSGRS
jgi:hypothetical protein